MTIDVFLLSNQLPLIFSIIIYQHPSMRLIKASNSQSIFSVLLCFLLVQHTPILLQTQFIGPTFGSSSQDDVHCSIAYICLWLSYSYISNVIKRLAIQEIVMFLMYGMHCSGTIGQAVLQPGCGLEVKPGNGAQADDGYSQFDCYQAL